MQVVVLNNLKNTISSRSPPASYISKLTSQLTRDFSDSITYMYFKSLNLEYKGRTLRLGRNEPFLSISGGIWRGVGVGGVG